MKRNIIYTVACLVAFASCQKQEVAEAPSQVEVAVELTASAAADATKTVMTEYNAHWWSVSDKISLFYTVEGKTGHSVFTSKNYIPAASAKFAGSLSLPAENTDLTTVSALAVYPATTADASDGTSVNVTVPSVQTAVEGSFMEGAYPVVAKTSDLTAALSFKAVCGGVKVSFQTPGITSFTFDAKGAKIAGTASVTFDADGNPVATTDKSAVSVITVNAPAGGFEVGKWYYMTALPATISGGYKITLHGGEADGTELAGSSDITIKRSVFGVLDSKDAPGKYADIKANLKPISWWDEMKDFMLAPMAAPYTENAGDKNNWAQHLSKIKYVRFTSDESYVYGYIETEDNLASYPNLNFWIDADGIQEGQGGGWWFSSHKGFEKAVSGKCYNNGAVVSWIPKLYDQITSGVKIGTLIDTPSVPGYGEGVNDNGIFKYSFIVDRRVVKIRNMSSVIVGINLTAATTESNQINPNRGGFLLSLQNSEPILDGTPILKKVRGVDEWGSVEYASITNKGNNRGDTRLKFDSDSDYIYGYIEVPNTDNLYFKNAEYYEFCPGFIKRLAIGIDLDGVEIGQGIGWPIGNCWETVLNGTIISCSRPLSDEDKALGWKDRWGHYIFPSDKFDPATIARPAYTITPEVWTPTLNDASAGGLGTVKAGTEYWQYFATGKGEWKDKCFRYSFAIERNRLGLKDLTEVKLGVFMYEDGVSGYSNTPDAVGTTLKLNN